jgi:hypothetical protein
MERRELLKGEKVVEACKKRERRRWASAQAKSGHYGRSITEGHAAYEPNGLHRSRVEGC